MIYSGDKNLCITGIMSIGAPPSMVQIFGGASQIRFFGDELKSIETALCNKEVASAEQVVRQNWEKFEALVEWGHADLAATATELYMLDGVPLVLESKTPVPFGLIDRLVALVAQKFNAAGDG